MHVLSAVTVALAAFSSSTLAAICHHEAKGENCMSKDDAKRAVAAYCRGHFHRKCVSWKKVEGTEGGVGYVAQNGKFKNEDLCVKAGLLIVEQCYGIAAGGSRTRRFSALDFRYCEW
ncbi:uncharacterized protein CIMG_09001 [Coccidioides immitis RS]|uniref:Secreted protein n=4 Tax=Coccidioides immitis TaxID=5501 RepID=A0A0E1RV45_COCIM|nr:uncharacterized protein CIMG_09001 [Coccidioides immitis RS]KMP08584.1 hypothetical protein CIRG_08265 [Coccidioides immitis RMSCC 2394]KMU78585.1 hypothetical protein CISG_01625 [Coccidioides immitis RMSCC 3703]KMU87399.1 hypothetical protein CIHG_05193 [Coccidioides immitis H538.4]TPX20508.1 hypothetical protein DIZ76_016398 [Coccidioides immitis]EAS27797.2 hypothetical protein CIMG_09001 [Coccidioides immitis RS]